MRPPPIKRTLPQTQTPTRPPPPPDQPAVLVAGPLICSASGVGGLRKRRGGAGPPPRDADGPGPPRGYWARASPLLAGNAEAVLPPGANGLRLRWPAPPARRKVR